MSDNDSDNIIARKPAVISAADGVGGGRRTARTAVGAVLGALVLAGGGFFVGAGVVGGTRRRHGRCRRRFR